MVKYNKKMFLKYNCIFICILFLLGMNVQSYSQNNMGIGTTTPDASAVLELLSTSQGFLAPRMTTAQRNSIASPATGLMIYNTDNTRFEYNAGLPATPNWIGLISTAGVSFDLIRSGTNTSQTLIVGNASTFTFTTGGIISANRFTGLGSMTDYVDLATSEVSGTLPIGNGGTNGTVAPTAGAVAAGTGTQYTFSAAGTNGQILRSNGAAVPSWSDVSSLALTSVGLTMPTSEFDVANTPLTSNGIFNVTWDNQNINLVFAGPSSGAATAPTFRHLVTADLPSLSSDNIWIGNSSGIPIEVTLSGDGLLSYSGALTVTGLQNQSVSATVPSNNQFLKFTAGSWTPASLAASDLPALVSANIWVGNSSDQAISVAPGGDLLMNNAGLFTVTAIQNRDVSNAAPANNDVLKWNGTEWAPATDAIGITSISAGTGIVATPDPITATGTIALSNTGVFANTYGSATTVPLITVDAQGRITAASNLTISGVSPVGSALTNGYIWVGNAGGTASEVPVSGDALLINTGSVTVTGLQGTAVSAVAPTNNQFLKYNGTQWVASSIATSDLPGLASANIWVGNAGGTATAVGVSGDILLSNTGSTTVTGLQGVTIAATAPTANQVLQYNGVSSSWEPATIGLPNGTADGQTLRYNNGTSNWVASDYLTNTATAVQIGDVANYGQLEIRSQGTNRAQLQLYGQNNTFSNSFQVASDLALNIQYTLPATLPAAGTTGVLQSTDAGILTWSSGGSGVSGSGTATQIAFWETATTLTSSPNLYWDNTNYRLGIGTNTPGTDLYIFKNNASTNPLLSIEQSGSGNSSLSYLRGTYSFTSGIDNGDNNNFKIRNTGSLGGTAYNDANTQMRIHSSSGSEGIVDFNHQSRVRAYQSSNQDINTDTWTTVEFNSETFDERNEFASYSFTAKQAGYYQVNARIEFDLSSFGGNTLPYYVSIAIAKNNTIHSEGNKLQVSLDPGTGTGVSFQNNNAPVVNDIIYLDAGDIIDIRAFQNIGWDIPLVTGSSKTYFSIHKLS